MRKQPVVIWQQIVSLHQVSLARALESCGFELTYCARQSLSDERRLSGWIAPALGALHVEYLDSDAAALSRALIFDNDSIHLCEGLTRNGYIEAVQNLLRHHRRRVGVMMEAVDTRGIMGLFRRLSYDYHCRRANRDVDFILAIGAQTRDWVISRGFSASKVYPFTYFLESGVRRCVPLKQRVPGRFRIGFVGEQVARKRVDLLVNAIATLQNSSIDLLVAGDGPLAAQSREEAISRLRPERVSWFGRLRSDQIPMFMASLDCLVLPSDHDGWGAVVSEALLAGVPAICSDRCGAAAAVRASGIGGVFPAGNALVLSKLLRMLVDRGPMTDAERESLGQWADGCLNGYAGARYFSALMDHVYRQTPLPAPPWADSSRGG